MFIKGSKLDAVLKKAYKGAGIHLERQGDILAVGTAYMYLEVDLENATNEFKAIITKYNGEVPDPGFVETIAEDKEQVAIPGTIYRGLFKEDFNEKQTVNETDFTYQGEAVLQTFERDVMTVPGKEWAVYDESQMDDKESFLETRWKKAGDIIVLKSNHMVLAYIYKNPDDTLDQLSEVSIA